MTNVGAWMLGRTERTSVSRIHRYIRLAADGDADSRMYRPLQR
jgi:hypothetical protein